VLSPTGLDVAKRLADEPLEVVAGPASGRAWRRPGPKNGKHIPKWDRDCQELRIGQAVVRQFKVASAFEEMILAAFEELHWPRRIAKPLPPEGDNGLSRRLQGAVDALNRRQKWAVIQFAVEGDAAGINWQFVEATADLPASRPSVAA